MWTGFQKPKRLSYDAETMTDRYGRFYAQPFERGFGTTIGNSLRRALLSSIEGAAITAVRIEGVLHEFSSIPGVVEDATDIILNLKQIPFKMHTNEPKTLRVSRSVIHFDFSNVAAPRVPRSRAYCSVPGRMALRATSSMIAARVKLRVGSTPDRCWPMLRLPPISLTTFNTTR